MLQHLPPDCALERAGVGEGFITTDYLLLHVVDLLAMANWQRGNAGQPPHKQSPRPQLMPRPGSQTKRPNIITAAALLEQRRRLKGGEA